MLRRLAALTGMTAAALLALAPLASADEPAAVTDGVGLGYGATTAAIDLATGVTGGALDILR